MGTGNTAPLLQLVCVASYFFFSSRRRHTRLVSDWSSDVCSSDLRCSAQPPPCSAGRWAEHLAEPEADSPAKSYPDFPDSTRGAAVRLGGIRGMISQIGRASCRERGEISGVGGCVKKRSAHMGDRE